MNRALHPIDIAYAISSMVVGGAERQLLMLIEGLDRARYRPWLLTMYPGAWDEKLAPLGVDIVTPPSGLSRLARFAFLRRTLSERKPHLLHCVGTSANVWIRLAGSLAGVETIVTGIRNAPSADPSRLRILERVLSARTAACIANSVHAREGYLRRRTLPPERVTVVRNALDIAAYRPQARHGGSPTRIGMAGEWRAVKNPDLHIAVAVELARDPAFAFEFHIAGEGEAIGRMKAMVRKAGVEDKMRFCGWVDDMPGFLAGLDMLLHLPRSEGMPNVVMEAMASGLPSIVSAIPGNAEVVTHGETGLIVAQDAVAAAAAIRRLLDDPSRASAIGAAARTYAEQAFSPARMVAETTAVYDMALAADHGR